MVNLQKVRKPCRCKQCSGSYTETKKINWLYNAVQDDCVEQAAKEVIEVSKNATSTMLNKATVEDMAGFQAYMIRHLDNKLSNSIRHRSV